MGKLVQHVTKKEASRLTLTEALAEIKTIGKRLEQKQSFVNQYACRMEVFKDPLHQDGGSPVAIQRERQAMHDLEERIVAIRAAIAKANAGTSLTVGAETRTVADWLTWKREVAPRRTALLIGLRDGIAGVRRKAVEKGVQLRAVDTTGSEKDVIVNVDESQLAKQIEAMETIVGTLDGKLSHINATTFVDL